MGIAVEFNPALCLRNISEYKSGQRKIEECVPEPLVVGQTYPFLKKEQRNFWLLGEVPLTETTGGKFSRPIASIIILEATHFVEDNQIYTKGIYKVAEIFNDDKIHFECYDKIN
ncbi:MAG: hypothetical protein WC480_04370 [Patescibacteria group bacterium]